MPRCSRGGRIRAIFDPITARPVTDPILRGARFDSDEPTFSASPVAEIRLQLSPNASPTTVTQRSAGAAAECFARTLRLGGNRRCSSASHGTARATVGTTKRPAAARYPRLTAPNYLPRPESRRTRKTGAGRPAATARRRRPARRAGDQRPRQGSASSGAHAAASSASNSTELHRVERSRSCVSRGVADDRGEGLQNQSCRARGDGHARG